MYGIVQETGSGSDSRKLVGMFLVGDGSAHACLGLRGDEQDCAQGEGDADGLDARYSFSQDDGGQ